jgi:hypothetical protein
MVATHPVGRQRTILANASTAHQLRADILHHWRAVEPALNSTQEWSRQLSIKNVESQRSLQRDGNPADARNQPVPTLHSALLQRKIAKEPLPDKGIQQSIGDRSSIYHKTQFCKVIMYFLSVVQLQ